MKYLIVVMLLFLFTGCEDHPKIIDAVLLKESAEHGLPIMVCLDKISQNHSTFPSRIRLETKDGFVLDRSDILISSDEKCSYLNVYVYFSLKHNKEAMKFRDKIEESVKPDNIKKLEIFLSDSYGTFYNKEDEFTYFIKE